MTKRRAELLTGYEVRRISECIAHFAMARFPERS